MNKRIKLILVLVFLLSISMNAMAWRQLNQYTTGGAGGRVRIDLSLEKNEIMYNNVAYGSYIAKQNFSDSNLKMDKFITTMNTYCSNSVNNKTYSATTTNKNSCSARTKMVVNDFDDTGINTFGLKFEYQSTLYGNGSFGRTIDKSQA